MKPNKYIVLPALVIITLAFFSCNRETGAELDGPTSGKIAISVDETLQPFLDTQVSTFESIYTGAHLNVSYKPEADAVADLLNDSARLIIAARELTPEEKSVFTRLEITPRVWKIAYDAVVLIVSKDNPDSLFDIDAVKALLAGKITRWNQCSQKSKKGSAVKIIFDNKNSGVVNYLKGLLPENKIANSNAFAVNSSPAVIDYVKKDPNAIGFVSLSWLSDSEDTTANSFLSAVTVAEIAPEDSSKYGGFYYKPYLANIAQKKYPFMRGIYIISREARAGLGLGFSSFVAGEKGQRMILKAGLLPATMPIRLIEVDNENLQIERDKK